MQTLTLNKRGRKVITKVRMKVMECDIKCVKSAYLFLGDNCTVLHSTPRETTTTDRQTWSLESHLHRLSVQNVYSISSEFHQPRTHLNSSDWESPLLRYTSPGTALGGIMPQHFSANIGSIPCPLSVVFTFSSLVK